MLFETTKIEAINGDASAQYNLGKMYATGEGVAKDVAQAVFWYRKAAEQGYAIAQFALGEVYFQAYRPPMGFEAFEWFHKAAEQGLALAQSKLGYMYSGFAGSRLGCDYKKSYFWLGKAANQGDAEAQYFLGLMSLGGIGVPQNDSQAFCWFRRAADQGYALAQFKLGEMYRSADWLKDEIWAYAWYSLSSESTVLSKTALDNLVNIMTPEARMKGQQRTKELQKEIEERQKAKAAGK